MTKECLVTSRTVHFTKILFLLVLSFIIIILLLVFLWVTFWPSYFREGTLHSSYFHKFPCVLRKCLKIFRESLKITHECEFFFAFFFCFFFFFAQLQAHSKFQAHSNTLLFCIEIFYHHCYFKFLNQLLQ